MNLHACIRYNVLHEHRYTLKHTHVHTQTQTCADTDTHIHTHRLTRDYNPIIGLAPLQVAVLQKVGGQREVFHKQVERWVRHYSAHVYQQFRLALAVLCSHILEQVILQATQVSRPYTPQTHCGASQQPCYMCLPTAWHHSLMQGKY